MSGPARAGPVAALFALAQYGFLLRETRALRPPFAGRTETMNRTPAMNLALSE
jgi:hypothetical protein